MERFLQRHPAILMEAAIIERIRRDSTVQLHPSLAHAPLVYEDDGKAALLSIYREYLGIAVEAGLPLLLCTPTWRANHERVLAAQIPLSVNRDAVRLMAGLRRSSDRAERMVRIGGMIGCRNDCYRPDKGLSAEDAERFHSWQIHELAKAGVDFLIAETLPSVEEAIGIARAMGHTGVPYIISFVISRDGRVLDGMPLAEAIGRTDDSVPVKPLGYMVNCAYPTFLRAAEQPKELFSRLVGYLANASSLDHCDLEQADRLRADSIDDWGTAMLELNGRYGVPIMGGCCGTAGDHLRYLARRLRR